ncbi:CRISPR-associated nuclease/helicase Cas3 subtype I-F/YPEST [Carnimonas sp. R-84981]|uniref:type I-F CRISPR-associated helicase Cas3f n=1 Tax=Carnimonas bestiolae TaxID=3402172 RepID=UPI003EDC8372
MNVLFVSQCNKNALKETRRILDQFAERRGDRTWQTPITQAGLDTLRKLLRKRARKNTAVACHWIRGHDHSELLWIVGNASQFNMKGATPTNSTRRNIVRASDENDWQSAHLIQLLASMAALFHDLGKASDAFQARLKGKLAGRNLYRHEWVSLRLLEAFVGDDDDQAWLTRLEQFSDVDQSVWTDCLKHDGVDPLDDDDQRPFVHLPPLAAAIGWLIVSHHRLPAHPAYDDDHLQLRIGTKGVVNPSSIPPLPEAISAAWNEQISDAAQSDIQPYWQFSKGLPVSNEAWRKRAGRVARQLKEVKTSPPLESPFVMHVSRMALMLADHYYSSLEGQGRLAGKWSRSLFANTTRIDRETTCCQSLDEHLLGVTRNVAEIVHRLPDMTASLSRIARHKGFRQRSRDARFRWQDSAFDLASGLREKSREHGFFGVNMASTGCGKTIANGRIMYALSDPEEGARFSIALGLRTLTLQTGEAYRSKLGLGSDDLAIRVGGGASKALFEHRQRATGGSESREELLDAQQHVRFDGQIDDHPLLSRVARDPNTRSLIAAPVLVCTTDHLVPATESMRGGHQIAPMLRLMSSDLVLDEPDDFDISDLPAVTRLVYWAGLLGARVVLSSATLPPALVSGLFGAYCEGRAEYQRHRGTVGLPVAPCCAWFDEYECTQQQCSDVASFDTAHQQFAQRRSAQLAKKEVLRKAYLAPLSSPSSRIEDIHQALVKCFIDNACSLHDHHHSVDPESGKNVSFGLIRMANIEPLVATAKLLYQANLPENYHIHLCVYHSQFPLLLRSRIEERLDACLDRHSPDAVFELADIRQRIDAQDASNQLFIVLGSPVTEVGRDHDYDWAIVEPSSMRSIIQLSGRIQRHRQQTANTPNVALLSTNVRHLENKSTAFCKPGFEAGDWSLNSHQLNNLLRESEISCIDSRPRLMPADNLDIQGKLADLEHARLSVLMREDSEALAPAKRSPRKRRVAAARSTLGAYLFFKPCSMNLSALPMQQQRFRDDPTSEKEYLLLPDETGEDYEFKRVDIDKGREYLRPAETEVDRLPDTMIENQQISPWNDVSYLNAVAHQAEAMELSLERCAHKFGRVQLKEGYALLGWSFHPALGFVRR